MEKIKNLFITRNFYIRFYQLLPEYKTKKEAYEAVEDEYYELYGQFKYSNYNTFIKSRDYHFKKHGRI